jgi:Kef-type K+ transport system membrane component KefB
METRSLGIESTVEGQKRAVLLRAAGGLSAILAVALFGVAAAILIVPPTDPLADGGPRPIAMRLLSLGSACAVGALLAVVAKEALRIAGNHRAEMLVVFLGVVGLAAGISADLGVSPLLPAMITGATLANLRTSGPSDSVANTAVFGRFILQAEHVVATIFALLAGVLLDPRVLLPGAAIVAALVLVRMLIKPAVFVMVDSSNNADGDSTRLLARTASIRQSPVAVALAVSLVVLASVEDAQRLLTIVVLVGIACDLLATIAVRRRSAAENSLNSDATA